MSKVTGQISISLDGYVAGPNGEADWMFRHRDEAGHRWVEDTLWQAGLHVMGSRSYFAMAGYWPTADTNTSAPEHEREYARRWKKAANVVFSRTLDKVNEPDRLVKDNVAEEIQRLKAQPGKSMVVGGAGLAASLMQLDLIDEVRLAIHPVILGGGKPVFPALDQMRRLKYVESRPIKGGVVVLKYQRIEPPA